MANNVLTLVIPSFNERNAIPCVLDEVMRVREEELASSSLDDLEVIVVDDCSSDNSIEVIKRYSSVKTIRHDKNYGYGAAIKTGIKAAQGNLVAFMDMDATYHVPDVFNFAEEILKRPVDMIVGHRNKDSSMPVNRQVGNMIFSSLVSFRYGKKIHDSCSGLRVVRKDFVDEYLSQLPNHLGFALDLTLHALANQREMVELPTNYKGRIGSSKLNEFVDGLRFLLCILRKK